MSKWTKPVVVGYDALKEAEFALQWAVQVARRRGVPLVVAHATGLEASSVEMAHPGIRAMHQQRAQDIAEEGARRARELGQGQIEVRAAGLPGGAAAALVEQSAEASLLVLGHRTRGLLTEAIMGSVALAVVTHADCPVAVVRQSPAPLPSMEHPVVVGIDGSEHSLRALDEAAFLAADTQSFLRVVTAWERPNQDAWSAFHSVRESQLEKEKPQETRQYEEASWSAYQRIREEMAGNKEEAPTYETLLAETNQQATGTAAQAVARVQARYPDLKVETVVGEGSAAQGIVKAATDASIIVVGARGHSAMQALLLGSVSRKVMNQAECAVYVIR